MKKHNGFPLLESTELPEVLHINSDLFRAACNARLLKSGITPVDWVNRSISTKPKRPKRGYRKGKQHA